MRQLTHFKIVVIILILMGLYNCKADSRIEKTTDNQEAYIRVLVLESLTPLSDQVNTKEKQKKEQQWFEKIKALKPSDYLLFQEILLEEKAKMDILDLDSRINQLKNESFQYYSKENIGWH